MQAVLTDIHDIVDAEYMKPGGAGTFTAVQAQWSNEKAFLMLPMAKPAIASVAIFNFLGLWNQFLLPVALNTNRDNYVLTQGMAGFASQAGYAVDFGALFAAVVITLVPVLVVYLVFQRQLHGSVSRGLMK